MPDMHLVRDGKLTFSTQPWREPIAVGDDAWRQWLRAPETNTFRFESGDSSFTARRDLRAGHAYWYAYRRRGPKLEKAYLGRSEEIDLDRLVAAAVRLSGSSSATPKARTRAPPSAGRERGYSSQLPTPATSLIGRAGEVAAAREYLLRPDVRLLTFTGPGGTGKTRMVIEVAASLTDTFANGVHFVDLSPIRDPALVHIPIAHALGIRDAGDQPLRETVRLYLEPRQTLLVLDNFEQVIAAAPLVAELLAECPGLKIAVTSREPLRVSWEHEWTVGPLALTAPDAAADRDRIARSPAVELFVARARVSVPAFGLTDENAGLVADICSRLDGLPLAIELAAAWVKLLPLAAIHARLVQSLALLTDGPRDAPERHQTMRSAIAWSYDLLDPEEQATFRRLSIFVGGFTIDAAEAVCGEDVGELAGRTALRPMVDRLRSLVDKNLIRPDRSATTTFAEARFRMLETIREFGLEKLSASGEVDAVQERHAYFFLTLAEEGDRYLVERVRGDWLDRLEVEHDNLRAALTWSLAASERMETGSRLATAMGLFWRVRGHFGLGRSCLAQILARTDDAPLSVQIKMQVLLAASFLATRQGDFEAARALTDQGIVLGQGVSGHSELAGHLAVRGFVACHQAQYSIARSMFARGLEIALATGNERVRGWILGASSLLAYVEGDYPRARSYGEESLRIVRERGEFFGIAMIVDTMGSVARRHGDYRLAQSIYEESLGASQALGDKWATAISLANLGHVARNLEDNQSAWARYAESLQIYHEVGDRRGIALTLGNLGVLAQRAEELDRARKFLTESLATARAVGDKRITAAALDHFARLALAQGDIPPAAVAYAESLQLLDDLQDRRGIARTLEGCASLLLAIGRPQPALDLCALADALLDSLGAHRSPTDQASYEELALRIQGAFGPRSGSSTGPSWNDGSQSPRGEVAPGLDLHQVVRRSLAFLEAKPGQPMGQRGPPEADATPLSRREREIAILIARGLTNRAIAGQLVISERTADTHVSNILGKLKLETRSQIAAWAADRRLIGT